MSRFSHAFSLAVTALVLAVAPAEVAWSAPQEPPPAQSAASMKTYVETIPGTELKFELVAQVAAHFKKSYKTIDIDGVRVIFPAGWGLLRASNTQPVLVMRFEAANDQLLKSYQAEVERVLEASRAAGTGVS